MDEIINKLTSAGVSTDMITQLKDKLGSGFQSEIMTGGLKAAAAKAGLDTSNLPDVDFTNLMEAGQELMGKDVDGDGKTGISEAIDNIKEAAANTDMTEVKEFAQKNATGLFAKIKSLFGGNA